MLTYSPCAKGRKLNNIMPAAIFCSVPCKAKPMATPAAPKAAIKLAVCTPNWDRTTTMVKIRIIHCTKELIIGNAVVSTLRLVWPRRRMARHTKLEIAHPSIKITMALTKSITNFSSSGIYGLMVSNIRTPNRIVLIVTLRLYT